VGKEFAFDQFDKAMAFGATPAAKSVLVPRTAASSTPTSFRRWCEEVLTSAIHGSATPEAQPAIPI